MTTTTNTTHSNATAQIRTATPSDLPRLTDIYNQAIATLSCTCDNAAE